MTDCFCNEINSCPICGGEAHFTHKDICWDVVCAKCGTRMEGGGIRTPGAESQLADRWNKEAQKVSAIISNGRNVKRAGFIYF